MNKLKTAYRWIKKNISWILGSLLALASILIYVLIRKDKGEPSVYQEDEKIVSIKKEINDLLIKKNAINEKDNVINNEINEIDTKIEELNKKIEIYESEVKGMTSKEKLEEFEKLGY